MEILNIPNIWLDLSGSKLNFIIATVVILVLVAVVSVAGMRGKNQNMKNAYRFILYMCIIGLVFTAIVFGVLNAGLL